MANALPKGTWPDWMRVSDAGLGEVNGLYRLEMSSAGTDGLESSSFAELAGTVVEMRTQPSADSGNLDKSSLKDDRDLGDEDEDDRLFRQMMKEELADLKAILGESENSQTYDFGLACWRNGPYTLLLEPWGLPRRGGGPLCAFRWLLFADSLGVNGYVPYYEAFQFDPLTGQSRHSDDWWWITAPHGVHPAPLVQPFDAPE